MKRKIFKKIYLLSLVSSIVSCPICFTSCSKNTQPEIKSIQLDPQVNYLSIGSSTQILVNNGTISQNDFIWTIETQYKEVYILNNGTVCVSKNLNINEVIAVKVKAVYKLDATKIGNLTISIVPESIKKDNDNNFFGFEENTLKYFGRDRTKQLEVKIVKTGKYSYALEHPIDMFAQYVLEPDNHFIDFKPICREKTSKNMRWNYTTPKGLTTPSFMPEDGYTWGDEIDVCPGLMVISPVALSDKIVVDFMCNGEDPEKMPKLTIDVNIWMNPDQSETAIFSYKPTSGDKHRLTPDIINSQYYMQMFCPSEKGTISSYTQYLSELTCFKQLHEYSNFTFEFQFEQNVDQRIKDAFSFDLSFRKYERDIDHFPMYRINFKYTFDMTKMPSSKEMGYANSQIGRIIAYDNKDSKKISKAWIIFRLEWL